MNLTGGRQLRWVGFGHFSIPPGRCSHPTPAVLKRGALVKAYSAAHCRRSCKRDTKCATISSWRTLGGIGAARVGFSHSGLNKCHVTRPGVVPGKRVGRGKSLEVMKNFFGGWAPQEVTREVIIPVQALQLFGLTPEGQHSQEDIMKAYEAIKDADIDPAYSARVIAGRQEILDTAFEACMKNAEPAVPDKEGTGTNDPKNSGQGPPTEDTVNDALEESDPDPPGEDPSKDHVNGQLGDSGLNPPDSGQDQGVNKGNEKGPTDANLQNDKAQTRTRLLPPKYNVDANGSGGKMITVPVDLLPGALAQLEQVEEHDLVLTVGAGLVEDPDLESYLSDIYLVLALSKCGKAQSCLGTGTQFATGCLLLEEGHGYFVKCRSSRVEGWLTNVEDFLTNETQSSVLNQLQLPLQMEYEKHRINAFRILQDLMAPSGSPRRSLFTQNPDRHFVKLALDLMSVNEVLELMDWEYIFENPKSVNWYYSGLVRKIANAHIVVAFVYEDPVLLEKLQNILEQPKLAADAHVQQAMSYFLMGEMDDALDFLEHIEGSPFGYEDKKDSKDDTEDEELEQVDATGQPEEKTLDMADEEKVTEGGGGDDEGRKQSDKGNGTEESESGKSKEKIGAKLSTDEGKMNGDKTSGANGTGQGFSNTNEKTARTVGAKFLPGRNQTLNFIYKMSSSSENSVMDGFILFGERWLGHVGFEDFRDSQEWDPNVNIDRYFGNPEVEKYMKARNILNPFSPAGVEAAQRKHEQRMRAQRMLREASEGSLRNNARKSRRLRGAASRKPSPFLVALMGGAVVGAALFAYVYRPWLDESDNVVLTEAQQARVNAMNVRSPISMELGEKIVKKWQYAKSSALGEEHEAKYLGRILMPSLHQEWSARVNDVVKRELYWNYKSNKCKVTEVDASHFDTGYGHVSIHAELGEVVSMHNFQGQCIDSYKTNYNVIYEVVLAPDGRWKISAIRVPSS